jgi:hypothetical protein
MKLLLENWKKFLTEAKKYICPPATQDLELNTRNRDSAIKAEHIQYGPLNLADEEYYDRLADHWNTTADVAKESNCGNCAPATPGLPADLLTQTRRHTIGRIEAILRRSNEAYP